MVDPNSYPGSEAEGPPDDPTIEAALSLGRRLLRCEQGAIYEDGIPPDPAGLALEACRLPIDAGRAISVDDREEPGARAFIGAPILVSGTVWGSLCFWATRARRTPFNGTDCDLVKMMAGAIGGVIEHRRAHSFDRLTGMPNREHFLDQLNAEVDSARGGSERSTFAIFFIDLDHFREINDTFGHERGDAVLTAVGERLRGGVGDLGLVARMSGDEFAVLLRIHEPGPDLSDFAERLRSTIDKPLIANGHEQYVTPSIGVAVFPDDGTDSETLLRHADVAMDRAKARGRNLVQFFTPVLNAATTTRLQQERALRKALDRGEFAVHYQPQFELRTGRLFGVEALVRWQHPKLGLIRPDLFIPNAELSSVIVALGERVMELACEQAVRWQEQHPDLRIAINLSARQFHESDLRRRLTEVLRNSGLRPETLEVEITESVAMGDAALSVEIMSALREHGMRICLDDFGTGYSSLGYLRRFPIDTLKIDQSFVRDIMIEPDDATIVQTVIAMAHNLGLDVCAEGVETLDQLEFLRAKGCDRVQGYYFSAALPPEDFTAYLSGRRRVGLVAVPG